MRKGIKIKNCVGVSLDHCRICGADIGVILYRKRKGDEDCKNVCTGNLCDTCKKVLEAEGCVIIEVKDGETDPDNPFRTGNILGVSKEIKDKLGITTEAAYMHKSMLEKLFGEPFTEKD